jgi:peptidoglycan/xylan/chitin deacetylase (PgdA/CDA1 family)
MSTHDHRIPRPPIAGAVAGIAMAGYLLPGLAAALPALRAPLGVEDRTAGGQGYALTFDDGPHAQGTPAVLELLATAGVQATFWQVRADIDRAEAIIGEATGLAPVLYRPPYGVLNTAALRLARARGRRTLLWSHWGRDWEARATPESIAARVTDGAGEGSVLLLHDADDYSAPGSWRRTVAALPRVLETLAARGIEPVAP